MWGKVRVCDPCYASISESHAEGFEEDLAGKSEMIQQLRSALSQSYMEQESSKRVMLELEAEASNDNSFLEEHARDPESGAHSFSAVQTRVQDHWTNLLAGLELQAQRQAELQQKHQQLIVRREEAVALHRELQQRRAGLDAELGEMAKAEAHRDELVRLEAKLDEEVAAVRRRVHELELERQEREARQTARGRLGGGLGGSRLEITGAERTGSGEAFTISAGRQDPLLARNRLEGCRDRLEGCRRACALM